MTYDEVIEYIHSTSWKGAKPGLKRIGELCEKLGNPQKSLKFIHVTGTNGKGSTCAMTESILRKAGYKTGLFTSPYILKFNERMMINGVPVSNEELAYVTSIVKPIADSMEEKPTEFDLITAIAFMLFNFQRCDMVVLEVGLGGRLDSTNIINIPLVSVITGVALDHMALLGDTIEKIAYEKAGIIKNGCPTIYGGTDYCQKNETPAPHSAYSVIKKKAKELSSKVYFCDYSKLVIKSATLEGAIFDYKKRKDLKVSLLGLYQPYNAAKAIEIIDMLKYEGFEIPEEAIYEGLYETKWPARFELLSNSPVILYDGSHNPDGIEQAINTIRAYFNGDKVNILTGVMKDKDYTDMVKMLIPYVNKVFTVTPNNERALDAESLANLYLDNGANAKSYEDLKEALNNAIESSKEENKPLICLGSLYLYSEIKEII